MKLTITSVLNVCLTLFYCDLGVSGLSSTNISLPWANRKNFGNDAKLHYFSKIGMDRLIRLYNIYKIDFEMFDYDVQPYMDLFKESSP